MTHNESGNDFLILEHYLHQSIKLRLSGGEYYVEGLREAHDISTIITRIIGILNAKPNVASFEVIEARKRFAKFIGLALFKVGRDCLKKFGPNCSVKGPCCDVHRLEGLKEAHDLFPKLFEPFGVELEKIDGKSESFFISLLALYADFKTQIIVSDLCSNPEKASPRNLENLLEIYFGSSMHVPYLKGKLQSRAVQIRAILEQDSSNLREALMQKFGAELFEGNLRGVLRNVYAGFPVTFMEEMINKSRDGGDNIFNNAKAKTVDTAKSAKSTDTTKSTDDISKSTRDASKNVRDTSKIVEDKAQPVKVENPFKNVVISGKFFRGILEPVDERFASIIEGRDVNVKQYLGQRKRRALLADITAPVTTTASTAKKAKTSIIIKEDPTITITNKSLMERHDSAEKISWETQQLSESENEDEEPVIRVSRPKSADKERTITSSNKPAKTGGRRRFSESENLNLIEGIRRFGRDWRRILDTYKFDDRSNVDLKDKARNLKKLGLIE